MADGNVTNDADVIVVGAGNAALCAALAAKEAGLDVIVLEKAPEHARGGNTYFTGGAIRFAYKGIEDVFTLVPDLSPAELESIDVGTYTESKYFDDLMRVTEGLSDQEMANYLVKASFPTMQWMYGQGVRLVPSWSHQAFKVGDKYRFWGGLCLEAVGGGKGLSDQLFENVLERDQPDRAAVFVHQDGQVQPSLEQQMQHLLQPRGFGHIDNLPRDRREVCTTSDLEAHPVQILQMHSSDRPVHIAVLAERET